MNVFKAFKYSRLQYGVSLLGLMMLLAVLALLAVLGMKVVPALSEFSGVKRAIVTSKAAGRTVHEIQVAFDKQADVGYISSIRGKDLEITKNGEEIEVSFSYQKKIPLFGPASLLLEFVGSTSDKPLPKPASE